MRSLYRRLIQALDASSLRGQYVDLSKTLAGRLPANMYPDIGHLFDAGQQELANALTPEIAWRTSHHSSPPSSLRSERCRELAEISRN